MPENTMHLDSSRERLFANGSSLPFGQYVVQLDVLT
jgi:hypothetical protein